MQARTGFNSTYRQQARRQVSLQMTTSDWFAVVSAMDHKMAVIRDYGWTNSRNGDAIANEVLISNK